MGKIWGATRTYERLKDITLFDVAWSKCDITNKELARKFGMTEEAVKQSLWRVRKYVKSEIESIK